MGWNHQLDCHFAHFSPSYFIEFGPSSEKKKTESQAQFCHPKLEKDKKAGWRRFFGILFDKKNGGNSLVKF